mmetsp:Transcript_9168/g.20248  ORF Transcript_9168/g.20248 Transcript_9168/m.20248 type:complete len:234 (-) Transcript_9168:640-1341(-)
MSWGTANRLLQSGENCQSGAVDRQSVQVNVAWHDAVARFQLAPRDKLPVEPQCFRHGHSIGATGVKDGLGCDLAALETLLLHLRQELDHPRPLPAVPIRQDSVVVCYLVWRNIGLRHVLKEVQRKRPELALRACGDARRVRDQVAFDAAALHMLQEAEPLVPLRCLGADIDGGRVGQPVPRRACETGGMQQAESQRPLEATAARRNGRCQRHYVLLQTPLAHLSQKSQSSRPL